MKHSVAYNMSHRSYNFRERKDEALGLYHMDNHGGCNALSLVQRHAGVRQIRAHPYCRLGEERHTVVRYTTSEDFWHIRATIRAQGDRSLPLHGSYTYRKSEYLPQKQTSGYGENRKIGYHTMRPDRQEWSYQGTRYQLLPIQFSHQCLSLCFRRLHPHHRQA